MERPGVGSVRRRAHGGRDSAHDSGRGAEASRRLVGPGAGHDVTLVETQGQQRHRHSAQRRSRPHTGPAQSCQVYLNTLVYSPLCKMCQIHANIF